MCPKTKGIRKHGVITVDIEDHISNICHLHWLLSNVKIGIFEMEYNMHFLIIWLCKGISRLQNSELSIGDSINDG